MDIEVLSVEGAPLVVSLDCDYADADIVTFETKTPLWFFPVGKAVVFTLDQVAELRDALDEFLAVTAHPAARPRPESEKEP